MKDGETICEHMVNPFDCVVCRKRAAEAAVADTSFGQSWDDLGRIYAENVISAERLNKALKRRLGIKK